VVFFHVFLNQARINYDIDNYGRPSQTNHQRAVNISLAGESLLFNHCDAAWLWNIGNEKKIIFSFTSRICMEKVASFNTFSWLWLKSEAHKLLYVCLCLCLCVGLLNLVKLERDLNVA